MPDFINGLPAQGSSLQSADVRENFIALNARTGKLAVRATVPITTSITVDAGLVFFADKISVNFEGAKIDLGDLSTGVAEFQEVGFFRDIVIVLRLTYDQNSGAYGAQAVYIEGPEKSSAFSAPELITTRADDIPLARFVVRHNGINLILKGQIEPIEQSSLLDYRNYLDAGGSSYYSATVGNLKPEIDGYGKSVSDAYGPIVNGETVGTFVANEIDNFQYVSPIQQAIDSLGEKGGTILLKRGVYDITSTIVLQSDLIRIIGEGDGTILQLDSGASPSEPIFSISGDNISVENMRLIGSNSQTAIEVKSNEKCTIKDCSIDQVGTGIEIQSSDRNIVTNCFFTNNVSAISFVLSSDYNIISANQFISSPAPSVSGNNIKIGNVTS